MYYSTIHHFVQICMVYFLRLRTGVNYLLIYRGLFLSKGILSDGMVTRSILLQIDDSQSLPARYRELIQI